MAHVINQHAGWVQGSTMAQKYTHYFGDESSISILEAYGIIQKDKQLSDILKPKQSLLTSFSVENLSVSFFVDMLFSGLNHIYRLVDGVKASKFNNFD